MTRATAIAQLLTPNAAACEETAAWIWGACRAPGTLLTMTTRRGRVPIDHADPSVELHEYRLEPDDLFSFGPYAATTRVRTAYDLLRSPQAFTQKRQIACRLLMLSTPTPKELLGARADRTSRSDRGRITKRLIALYGD